MKIYNSRYKDVPSIVCETEEVSAAFLPMYGGKCASIKFLKTGREVLAQAPNACYKKPVYAGLYTDSECSAFDDMFPTVVETYCTQFPWNGILMPDHGEVYSLPWQYEIEGGTLHMWVYSIRFAYRLDKWISETNSGIMMKFNVQNLSCFDFDFLYSAHCMLAAEESALLKLPYHEGSNCTMIASEFEERGGYASPAKWPASNGLNLERTPSKENRRTCKFWFDEPIPEGWIEYLYSDNTALLVSFDHLKLPWLGLWMNCGSINGMYNVAIEPSTAPFDEPNEARKRGKSSVLPANGRCDWHMHFKYKEL